jgi:threonine dehydratase
MDLTLDEFKLVAARIKPYINKTKLVRCEAIETYLNIPQRVFLKLENEQPTRSFKVRGAFNALLSLKPAEKIKGVVTRSSGNFAQAVAYAGQLLNIKAIIIMPTNAPEVKKLATQQYEPELIFAGITHEEGDLVVEKIRQATGANLVSPYNHIDVIKGQSTLALETYEELPTLQHFFCPIGGGGLMSGCAAALKLLNSHIETVGIEPEGAADYYMYRLQGHIVALGSINTICDGLRASQVGSLNRPILDQYVDKVSIVSDLSVIKAMKFLRDHCGLIIEPSGAAALAGLLQYKQPLKGDVVCVITGANVDMNDYEKFMKQV